MNYIILSISMLACLLGGMIKKFLGDRFESKNAMYHVYNAVVSFVSALSLLLISNNIKMSPFTIILGIIFGVVTAFQSIFNLKAFENGPYSYTSVIVSLSTIIPTLSGCIIWHEHISAIQIIGILLMLICFVCSVNFTDNQKKTSILWILYTFMTFCFTGFIGVMQKWHQSTTYKNELDGFLVIAFFISFAYSAIGFLYACSKKFPSPRYILKKEITLSAVIFMIIGGICAAANNKMNLYLSGVMESAIFFPTVNGGGLVLSTIASQIFFKEKLSKKQGLGVVLGIIAVVLLCNPF